MLINFFNWKPFLIRWYASKVKEKKVSNWIHLHITKKNQSCQKIPNDKEGIEKITPSKQDQNWSSALGVEIWELDCLRNIVHEWSFPTSIWF